MRIDWGTVIAAVLVLVLITPWPAHAHDWYSDYKAPGQAYDCCGGDDCEPLKSEDVVREGDTFSVRFRGLWTGFPAEDVQISEDQRHHACGRVAADRRSSRVWCLFVPIGM